MKCSRLEGAVLLLSAVFLAFALGWYLRGATLAQPLVVEAQRQLTVTETAFPAPTETPPLLVDLNTADLAALTALPGIGEKRAAEIIADRERNGPFRFPEDLARVKGIGEATVAELLDYITITTTGEDTP